MSGLLPLGGVSTACLGMSACTSFLAGRLTLAAWERVPALLPGWGVSRWSHQLLTATTLIYANGAGITVAAGTRLSLEYIGHSSITLGHKMSVCTACTSSGLGGLTPDLPVYILLSFLPGLAAPLPGWGD